MEETLLKQALNQIADQDIPTDYDPRPAMRKRFENHFNLPATKAEGSRYQPRLRLAAAIAMFALAAAVVFLLTPLGRGFAQQALRFFTHASSDMQPVPSGELAEPAHPSRTPALTQVAPLLSVTPAIEAIPVEKYPTATSAVQSVAGGPFWNLTLDQAQELAGFDVLVPASLPPGYRLDNIIYTPSTGEVSQFYEYHPYSAGEMFIFSQRLSPPAELIGLNALVEQLTIENIPVEYVKGGWFGAVGSGIETWHTDSVYHTYRWQVGETYFSLVFMFDDTDTWSPAYWTRDGMFAMAEIIMGVRAEFPEQVNYNNLTNLAQVESVLGYDLLLPTILPEGFVFTRAIYEPGSGRILLSYQPQQDSRAVSGVHLWIIESAQPAGLETWAGYPSTALEEVMVGEYPATFVRGMLLDGIYDPDINTHLVWTTPELSLEILYTCPAEYALRLDQAQLIAIAESMQ